VVVVTSLTRLEAKVQARGFVAGGRLDARAGKRFETNMKELLNEAPFQTFKLEGSIFETAIHQQETSTAHCRSLDRLHLAAMEGLGVRRLMTHDVRQADAARELGYEVMMPGVE
jgi:predicted nucleic acid-binding protein